ncbi:MAG TPA: hypothetical protein VG734_25365 [Lacunisphaera sp.]|nr:hypothetical protein [Lacunisphaera sp.]
MKRFLFAALFAANSLIPAHAGDRAGTVLIHPGETVYAQFEVKGKKIKLTGFTKDKNEAAQVLFTLGHDAKKPAVLSLKVENKFPRDLIYKLEMRNLTLKLKANVPVSPVVAGKVAFEQFPPQAEELALDDFQLAK